MRSIHRTLLIILIAIGFVFTAECFAVEAEHGDETYQYPPKILMSGEGRPRPEYTHLVGMGIGAVTGVALGSFVGLPTAVIGGVLGATAYRIYYATQHNLPFLERYGVQFIVMQDRIIILIPSDILFEPSTAVLLPSSTQALNAVVEYLKKYPNENIHISGNTDPIGSRQQNAKLSTAQAMQVAGYFWSHGIQKGPAYRHLSFSGNGAKDPIATNQNMTGMGMNRRIQINIYPNQFSHSYLPEVGEKHFW